MPDSPDVAAEACCALDAQAPEFSSFPNSSVLLGRLPVARALPVRGRRLVGPWCFLDRFGPLSFSSEKPMDVAPHPHIGLQTVTWLLDGEILHDDSLGCQAVARPGGVNVMTAGRAIAHSEQTPLENSHRLEGVQLWVALPEARRADAPSFTALPSVPTAELPGGVLQVFAGSLAGLVSPAPLHSPLSGADLLLHPGATLELPLDPAYEHALLVLRGDCALQGRPLPPTQLHYLGTRRTCLSLRTRAGARVLLIGGLPFPETVLMWWNFVARTSAEIAEARQAWEQGERFGSVSAYRGARLSAPPLPHFARPTPLS
jgi:redox-sensitive bicupin YhaK (pirin superfamily)